MLVGVLAMRNGKLFVACVIRLENEPRQRRLWWPVVAAVGNSYNGLRPQVDDIARSRDDAWQTSRPGDQASSGSVLTPRNVQASFVDEESVSCPKVRKGIEVRWHQGAWQKYSRIHGWIAA